MRQRRLAKGWSRLELSARSGVALATLQKFEQMGQISLERLLRLAAALDVLRDFERLLAAGPSANSLAELEVTQAAHVRVRGRTMSETVPTDRSDLSQMAPRRVRQRKHGA
ncbi:MAG: helix-turn-helix domain-containing protein [Gemmatimonadota bacterium]|nr:helix-turn-helix domain-containing protein [Gemmatimonadota bacterium]